MEIISVVNQKGGSGKTSFSVLACLALASQGSKVLAIDCDPQGGMSNFLLPSYSNLFDKRITDVLMGEKEKPYFSTYNNIWLYLSDYKLDKMYVTIDYLAFKRVLKMLKEYDLTYDYIILDTPPTMQGITRAAVHASDQIFVPCELSKSALAPTVYTLECLKEMEKEGRVVILNSKENNSGHLGEIEKEYKQHFNGSYAGSIKRDLTSQKIVSGDLKMTANKIGNYLEPVWRLIDDAK